MAPRSGTLLGAIAASALALAGCGGDDAPAPPAPATTGTVAETTPPAPTPPTPAPTKPTTIVIVVDEGRPRGGIKRPTIEKGDKVVLVVRADAGESVHLHGYDIDEPVTPGKPLRIPFTASIPGRFELELHHPDSLLAVLEVRP